MILCPRALGIDGKARVPLIRSKRRFAALRRLSRKMQKPPRLINPQPCFQLLNRKLAGHSSPASSPASPRRNAASIFLSMQTAPRTRPGKRTEINAPAAFATETSPLLLKPVNRHRPFAGGSRRNSASPIGAGSKRRSWPFGTAPATVGLEVRKPVAWPSLTLERLRLNLGAPLVAAVDDLGLFDGVSISVISLEIADTYL
jgi:hypothetical protein